MDSQLCKKSPKSVNYFINGIIHVFILLTIISAFFFVYVSNLARNKFHDEISDVVNDNLTPALEKADKDKYIKNMLKNVDLNRISNYFNRDNESTKTENSWLLKSTIAIIVILVLVSILSLVLIKIFCRKIPFTYILKENLILFTLIGTVEILFFLYIGKKFIPTKPSLVMETVVESLKKDFNK